MDNIAFSTHSAGVSLYLNGKNNENVSLFVCTSRDCKNCGIVIAIPWDLNKEEE
jgi:hypothetical protein